MDASLSHFAQSGMMFAAVLTGAAIILIALICAWRKRNTAEQRERRRRLRVGRQGRITDGEVVDIEERDGEQPSRLIHYTYRIGAVEYSACQDVSALAHEVGADPKGVVGAVSVKYTRANPYNSIIVCEEWSGLRNGQRQG